jgi:hypothetical protein
VSSKHFPPKAGGSGGIHAKRMKHDRHVSIYSLPQGGIHTFRDGCGDEGRSAAENFNGALVAPINAAERRNFAGGKERWMGRAKRWRSRSRGFLGQASLTGCGSVRWPEVWRGVGEIQARRASTQAQSRTSRRGLKPVKFGRDLALWLCDWNGRIQKYKRERLQK